jgi:ubiquinone biosynthesis protein
MSGLLRVLRLGTLRGGPAEFRRRLESLSPAFIKLGQYLALRPDVIPQKYADELMLLQGTVSAFPWPDTRQIISEELGDPSKFFQEIDPIPVEIGHLAQVHVGTLIDGAKVAIKVLHPGIQQEVARNLKDARRMARVVDLRGWTLISPQELADELAGALSAELDLAREATNMERLRELAHDSPIEKIPYVYPELSTSRVLTAEFSGGIPLRRVLAATAGEREQRSISAERLAVNLFTATLRQIFQYHFFQEDIHPANLKVLPGNAITYGDFGLCSVMDAGFRRVQIRYLDALYRGDVDAIYKVLLEVLIATSESDPEGLHRDLLALAHGWQNLSLAISTKDSSGFVRPPVAQSLVGALRAVKRNGYHVPAPLLAMYRTLVASEETAWRLGNAEELMAAGRDYFAKLRIEEAVAVLDPDNTRSAALTVLDLARDAPAQLNQILSELARGSFQLNVQLTENPRLARNRSQRYRLLTLAVVSIGIAFLMGDASLPRLGPVPARYVLGILLIVVYLRGFFLWRRMR